MKQIGSKGFVMGIIVVMSINTQNYSLPIIFKNSSSVRIGMFKARALFSFVPAFSPVTT